MSACVIMCVRFSITAQLKTVPLNSPANIDGGRVIYLNFLMYLHVLYVSVHIVLVHHWYTLSLLLWEHNLISSECADNLEPQELCCHVPLTQ